MKTSFRDIVHEKFKRAIELPDSEKYDAALSASVIDINMDLQKEIIIGTYAKVSLPGEWRNFILCILKKRFVHMVHSFSDSSLASSLFYLRKSLRFCSTIALNS